MVYLSVNKNTLTTSASDLLAIQKQLEICQSNVRSIQAALDSDIKECSGIDNSLSQVCSELSLEASALANMSRYLVNANDEYNKLDSSHIDDSSHVTIDGTTLDDANTTYTTAEIIDYLTDYYNNGYYSTDAIPELLEKFNLTLDELALHYYYIQNEGLIVVGEDPYCGIIGFFEDVDTILNKTLDFLDPAFVFVLESVLEDVTGLSGSDVSYIADALGISHYYEDQTFINGTQDLIGYTFINSVVAIYNFFSK